MAEELHTICPFCDYHHDRVSAARSDIDFPEDGDVTLCFRCGRFCVFDSDARGGLRQPTRKEQRIFARDADMNRMLAAWRITKRQ